MRWLVGWAADHASGTGGAPRPGQAIRPVGAQPLWDDSDPLWAVGDWRPDEVRLVEADGGDRLAVLGCCGASDEQLRVALFAARGGALRHLTAWPGSYTTVVRVGRRVTVTTDLAGARPVFHTPWAGGTAYATAALPLADLIEAQLDVGHLAALLACPEAPEALGDGTPYEGVRRVPPGHALIVRDGRSRETVGYEPAVPTVVAAPPVDADAAVAGVREALVEAVRVRLAAPRHAPVPDLDTLDPGPVPGMGPAQRRAERPGHRRRGPAPGIGADLSGGSASATIALLAAGLPGAPGTVFGTPGTSAGERLSAVTFNDLTLGPRSGREAELECARGIAENPRLHHVVVAAGEEALPYVGPDGGPLVDGPLTDEPGPSLVVAERHRQRLAAGSADHLTGHGAREVLDAHPARLADLLLDRRRRHLLRPVTALARAEGTAGRSVLVPLTVYRAARRLARTPYREGVLEAARRLRERDAAGPHGATGTSNGAGSGAVSGAGGAGRDPHGAGVLDASLAALAWCRPGPAARWLTGEALAEVSIRLERAALRPAPGEAGTRPGEWRARAALARLAADHRILEQAAEVRGQRLHAPFLDNQVVRACRALPEALRVQPGARASVLRAVLAGAGVHDLPSGWGAPSHATRAAAVRAGLRSRVGDLIDLFDAPLLADAGLVEARVVRRALRAAAEGEPLPLDGLAELVSTEVWLRRLLARRGSCWTGTAAPRQRAVAGGVPQRPSL
ncbi:asparagine synthase [Streptomyces sp. TRM43335]|uniref:Asparagine synthase n=1 Tax=Streptomyces taklimakanensis TaxID=2569853 RepID=A0A6G2BC27_9ACTN|nr:asparagine synthase-related protein [Streptomyces taklimakanensis]MTE19774.1 asparagine synthase [Streptomyces taklimakanensis]